MSQEQQALADVRLNAVRMSRIEQELALTCLVHPREDSEVNIGIASDVLSHVLARALRGSILVTTQHSLNLIAVASHIGIAAIIVTSGYRPGAEVLTRAQSEGIGVYATLSETFDVVGNLSQLGIKGRRYDL
jgi:hypothetical protein